MSWVMRILWTVTFVVFGGFVGLTFHPVVPFFLKAFLGLCFFVSLVATCLVSIVEAR